MKISLNNKPDDDAVGKAQLFGSDDEQEVSGVGRGSGGAALSMIWSLRCIPGLPGAAPARITTTVRGEPQIASARPEIALEGNLVEVLRAAAPVMI